VIAISFYWAVTTEQTSHYTTYSYEEITNRVQEPIVMNTTTSTRWGEVPGQFNSSWYESILVQYFSSGFFSPKTMIDFLRIKEQGVPVNHLLDKHFKDNTGSSATVGVSRSTNPYFNMSETTS